MISVPLRSERYHEAARTLARAFFKDPALRWVFPDAERRETRIQWIFERWVPHIAEAGTSTITAGSEGVALWVPPGERSELHLWHQIRAGLLVAPLVLGMRAVTRMMRLDRGMKRRLRGVFEAPHWHLAAIGIDPRDQGRGRGRKLLERGLERIDRERLPAALITYNPRTLDLYASHGFEIVADGPACRGGPVAWTMRRPERETIHPAAANDDAEAPASVPDKLSASPQSAADDEPPDEAVAEDARAPDDEATPVPSAVESVIAAEKTGRISSSPASTPTTEHPGSDG